MSMFDRIRSAFRREPPAPALRNRPGGMAYIRGVGDICGAESLNGHIVQTVSVDPEGFWCVHPKQAFTATDPMRWNGVGFLPGDTVPIRALADSVLVPLKDPGHDERDESARWLPPVPTTGLPTIASTRVPAGGGGA